MTIKISQPAPCQHTLKVTLGSEAILPIREVVVREFQKEAAIAGFRKGKAPRDLVERQFPSQIRDETIRRLTRQVFEQVTTEKKLKPVGPFEVTKLDFDEAKGLDLEAQVEVEPEFRLADYKGLALKKPAITVSAEDVKQALARLQESVAELAPTKEGQPKEKRVPNLDDEFAKDVGFETLEQLHTHVEGKLREQRQAEQAQALEQALCDELLARHRVEVPPGLVVHQTQRLTQDFQVRLILAGMAEEKVSEEMGKYTEQLRTNAVRHVKLAFILERIAEKETLAVTQDEAIDRLWKLAQRSGKDPAELRRVFDAKGLWPSVLSSIRQEKTMAFLLSVAQIETSQETGNRE